MFNPLSQTEIDPRIPATVTKAMAVIARADELMAKHGLPAMGWKFTFIRSIRTLGLCSYREKAVSLSEQFMLTADEELINDTILHEIAHALTPGAGHNWRWKMKCVEIGANPERCLPWEDMPENMPRHEALWEAFCPSCNRRFKWKKRPHARMDHGCYCPACGSVRGRLTIKPVGA